METRTKGKLDEGGFAATCALCVVRSQEDSVAPFSLSLSLAPSVFLSLSLSFATVCRTKGVVLLLHLDKNNGVCIHEYLHVPVLSCLKRGEAESNAVVEHLSLNIEAQACALHPKPVLLGMHTGRPQSGDQDKPHCRPSCRADYQTIMIPTAEIGPLHLLPAESSMGENEPLLL